MYWLRNDIIRFKGTGHYWKLLKIVISIKTKLVTSNGNIKHWENAFLWNVVFEKEVTNILSQILKGFWPEITQMCECYLAAVKGTGHLSSWFCQRPVFSLGLSQHMNKIPSLWKSCLNCHRSCKKKNKEKNTLVPQIGLFHLPNKIIQLKLFFIWVRN